jgi:hypothetical protein
MDTVRCPRCNKLLRANAQSCSRCGIALPAQGATRKRGGSASQSLPPSQPTSPLASPHRAGHYSGLHAEDQPFQSSFFMRIQRTSEPVAEPAPDGSSFLALETAAADAPEPELAAVADLPTYVPRRVRNTPIPQTALPPSVPRPAGKMRIRGVPLLLSAALLCFLVASGLLTLLLLAVSQAHTPGPQLLASPGELRVGDILQLQGTGFAAHRTLTLVRDDQIVLVDVRRRPLRPATDGQGAFLVHVSITSDWNIGIHRLLAHEGAHSATASFTVQAGLTGPARLQLGLSRLDLGSGFPGTRTHKDMTLINAGGGQVRWSARSEVAWLSLSPASGSFAGNALVTLTANRSGLSPQAYVGQVVFTQTGGSTFLLYVSMTVDTTPAFLALSTASLAFSGTPVQSPAGQAVVIENTGGQTLNWISGTTTADGADWLSVTPAAGALPAHTSAILLVNVNTLPLASGSYQGALSFSYAGGPSQQVAVTLAVNPPPLPVMHISAQNLSFTANQGVDPPARGLTISNTGNAPLNWAIHADASGLTYLGISPLRGSVPPAQSITVSVAPVLGSANGTITATLTVLDSDPGTAVPAQQVSVSITITSQAVITLVTGPLEFDHDQTISDTSELLVFRNSGSLPLHWALTSSAQVAWLSFDTIGGTLSAGEATYISVHCVSGQLRPGTYTLTLTLKDSDPATVVRPETVTVTLVVIA